MAKFDFNNSRYASLFESSDFRFLQTFVDESEMLKINYGWWRTQFAKAANITPTDAKGKATFTVAARSTTSAPMADLRAPLGDSTPMDKEGFAWYSATIPDFITPGIVETAMEREYKERMFAQFGNDAEIIRAWVHDLQIQQDSYDQTFNNLGAQLQSTGKMIYNSGRGIKSPLHKAEIPVANFVNGGIWGNVDFKILDKMVELEKDFRDRTGFSLAMKWLIPHDVIRNVFFKNKQVLEWINYTRAVDSGSLVTPPAIGTVMVDMFYAAIAKFPGLSRIEEVVEKQKNLTWESTEMVHGWDAETIVLRPEGMAGDIQYTDLLDQQLITKYGNSQITSLFASLDGGIAHIVNSTMPNGRLKEWHTDLMFAGIPSLTEFPHHVIVNITQE